MTKSVKTGSEELGRLIRQRRQELGLRRRDLVEATGLSYPYVSQIETGYRLPSDRAVRDLAAALQVEPAALIATMPAERQALSAPTDRAGLPDSDWFANPGFIRAPSVQGSRACSGIVPVPVREAEAHSPRGPDAVVDDVLRVLAGLGVEEQLEALAAAQRHLVARLVQDRSRRPAGHQDPP